MRFFNYQMQSFSSKFQAYCPFCTLCYFSFQNYFSSGVCHTTYSCFTFIHMFLLSPLCWLLFCYLPTHAFVYSKMLSLLPFLLLGINFPSLPYQLWLCVLGELIWLKKGKMQPPGNNKIISNINCFPQDNTQWYMFEFQL